MPFQRVIPVPHPCPLAGGCLPCSLHKGQDTDGASKAWPSRKMEFGVFLAAVSLPEDRGFPFSLFPRCTSPWNCSAIREPQNPTPRRPKICPKNCGASKIFSGKSGLWAQLDQPGHWVRERKISRLSIKQAGHGKCRTFEQWGCQESQGDSPEIYEQNVLPNSCYSFGTCGKSYLSTPGKGQM